MSHCPFSPARLTFLTCFQNRNSPVQPTNFVPHFHNRELKLCVPLRDDLNCLIFGTTFNALLNIRFATLKKIHVQASRLFKKRGNLCEGSMRSCK